MDFEHADLVTVSNGVSTNSFQVTRTIQPGLNYKFDWMP